MPEFFGFFSSKKTNNISVVCWVITYFENEAAYLSWNFCLLITLKSKAIFRCLYQKFWILKTWRSLAEQFDKSGQIAYGFIPGENLPNTSPTLFAYRIDLNVGWSGFSSWKLRSEEDCLCCIEVLLKIHINCTSAHKSQECPLALWLVGEGEGIVLTGNSWAWIFQWCTEWEI